MAHPCDSTHPYTKGSVRYPSLNRTSPWDGRLLLVPDSCSEYHQSFLYFCLSCFTSTSTFMPGYYHGLGPPRGDPRVHFAGDLYVIPGRKMPVGLQCVHKEA